MFRKFFFYLLVLCFRPLFFQLHELALEPDGAGRHTTRIKIILPLSLPPLATLSLIPMAGHWNSWFDGMIYNTNVERYPLATLLLFIVVQ